MELLHPATLAFIALAYLLGSVVKGVAGFGALLIAVPLMSIVLEPATAVALTSGSVLVSNIWQLRDSGHASWAFRRFWILLLVLLPATLIGSQFLVVVDPRLSGGVIGVIVVLYCASRVFPLGLSIPAHRQRFTNPLVGTLVGLIGGATILSGSILATYLLALNLKKNEFVGAIALMYLVNAIPIYLTLSYFGRYTLDELVVSVALIAPALFGFSLGRRIRDRVSQALFERIVTAMLVAVGLLLLHRAW
jgi:uncharacterized membrane protein YfcA